MNIDPEFADIQRLYKKIKPKNRFFELAGKRLGKSSAHVRVNYFGLWNIPEKQMEPIKTLLTEVVKLQNKFNSEYKSLENK